MTPEQRLREAGERLVEVIARQEWLNPWGYKLEHAMAVGWDLLGGRRDRVRNVLHGTWLGQPLHPVLTDGPLGAWTLAFAFDALDAGRLAFGRKHRLSLAWGALRVEGGLDGQGPRNLSPDLLRNSSAPGKYRSPSATLEACSDSHRTQTRNAAARLTRDVGL